MIRTFIALPLPDSVKQALEETTLSLKGRIDARWVRANAMHLTLKFLGDIAEDIVPALGLGLDVICAQCPELEFSLDVLGAFPGRSRARIIWASLTGAVKDLASLAAQMDRLCARYGIPPETRTFRPHITLGRLKTPTMLDLDIELPRRKFTVAEARVYRSELLREGPRYTVLHVSRLGNQ
jgi:2'-5' RNA ligase